jgi:hypothetical protein
MNELGFALMGRRENPDFVFSSQMAAALIGILKLYL